QHMCRSVPVSKLFFDTLMLVFDSSLDQLQLLTCPTRRSSDLYCAPADNRGRATVQVTTDDIHMLNGIRVIQQRIGKCRVEVKRRSEEHTSELQSRENLVCRLLLEKKNKIKITEHIYAIENLTV